MVVFGFLFVLATWNHHLEFTYPNHIDATAFDVHADFSALQAEALLHGRLAVRPTPTDLLILDDPWNPDTNIDAARCCGYHDLSLNNDKIYAPQGFGTAVLIDIPTRLFGLGYANGPLKNLILVTLGSWSLLQLTFLIRLKFSDEGMSLMELLLCFAAILIANPATWLIVVGHFYAAAIAAGYMGMACGALILWYATNASNTRSRSSFPLLATGVSMISLGAASRPSTLFVGIAVGACAILALLMGRNDCKWFLGSLTALFVPAAAIGGVWMWFNHARFGSIFETGHKFQLAGFNMRTYPIGSFEFVATNVRRYLFTPFHLEDRFPYLFLAPGNTSTDLTVQSHEDIVGAMIAYPLLLAAPFIVLCLAASKRAWPWFTGAVLVIGGSTASLLAISWLFKDSTMRYLPDFSTGLVLLSSVMVSMTSRVARRNRRYGYLVPVILSSFLLVSLPLLLARSTWS